MTWVTAGTTLHTEVHTVREVEKTALKENRHQPSSQQGQQQARTLCC